MTTSLLKIIIGVIFIVVSAWWIIDGSSYLEPIKSSFTVTSRPALADLITVINGSLPLFVILIALLIVWLELDGMRIRKEIKTEDKKS
ncbi:MAG: hypothetical protein HYW23_03205 [Candidatus Aenigmarchaeota archaeon]|nr:hypothetical protein [Candidatus Aenigmarchaeota archaeon]